MVEGEGGDWSSLILAYGARGVCLESVGIGIKHL